MSPFLSCSSVWWPSSAAVTPPISQWRRCCCCCGRVYWWVGLSPFFHSRSLFFFNNKTRLLFQFTLGGFEQLQNIKVRQREELGLPPLPEDSIRVIRSMRAASPPASASDLIEQQQKRARREHKVGASDHRLVAYLSVFHMSCLSFCAWLRPRR